tara:strand:- start:16972 stop:17142 length:171 start_codon:yes stop_codon:yes gene_type:complete
MNRKKSKKKNKKIVRKNKVNNDPRLQKFALLLFGLGPIAIMGYFLYSRGFFDGISY